MIGLEVSHLRKSYGQTIAVDDVSFRVDRGEIYGIIGPNGAGKSTCMNLITGLLKADSGSVSFNGRAYDPQSADMRGHFGLVPQDLAIYPELTAVQNLRFFGQLSGLSGAKLKQRIEAVLNLTGLVENTNQTVETFSGGMARRLNFGVALLHEPSLVVLDEPTVGIDPQSRTNLLDGIRLLGKQGVAVLYASHYMEEVASICDRIGIIDHGKLLKEGTLDQLIDRTGTDISIHVDRVPDDLASTLAKYANLQRESDGTINICLHEQVAADTGDEPSHLRRVLELLENARIPRLGMTSREMTLETLFLSLTGRRLRD